MDSFEELISAVRSCSLEQKQRIFQEIRGSILIHDLERQFKVRAEVILEAINRSSDLSQRGIRGLIAETVFALDVLPTAVGWQSDPPIGNTSYDACLQREGRRVRIQVKTQRRKSGEPMLRRGLHVVEVQRTRSGEKDGEKTRPYRFDEFDLLAVCMQASTGNWDSFNYASAASLVPSRHDPRFIETLQSIPNLGGDDHGIWTSSLLTALQRVT